MRFYNYFLRSIRNVPVPTICAVHGPAMGAGAGLALACDLRVAVDKATCLGLHFSSLGIHSGMGASHYLPNIANNNYASVYEILLLGKTLNGKEAHELGLVHRLVHDEKACFEMAHELALDIATKQHPVAIRTMIKTLRLKQDEGLQSSLQNEAYAQALCYNRNDWGEGLLKKKKYPPPTFDDYHQK
eukprot:CAMPEP_0118715590 /NCGR_PEP_ID=MMETSP0800-20121206/26976_1 /TAXON_ID=210618 ORGANISM="Striatella unipunctata, Strain CCMP2910" /NCGR_SAMPLE_ID=MMETSP0800 /ASSEMBLY_ACC=CAM_ASM_000638 /LENGTH=186 /DNA_ID=CAMNT_0006621809 /DNA_START=1 /DNA_END=561 /DNA_ORIENTATION=+